MAITIGGYSQFVSTGSATTWSGVSSTVGAWLIVVQGASGGLLANMGDGDPGAGYGWPGGSWQLLAQVDAGPGLPKLRVWAVRFVDTVSRSFKVGDDTDGLDVHSHLYFLHGVRPGLDAADVFSVGASDSTNAGESASQQVPTYSPDTDGLLIGAWISGELADYSSLGGLTARDEVDGDYSTSRTGEETLSAAGPSSLTASSSVSASWAAVSIAVRADADASVTFSDQPLQLKTEAAFGANPNQDPAYWAGLWTDISDDAQSAATIERGRSDETSTVQPSSLTLQLNNEAGRYVRQNPLGPYYGLLNKNTPLRHWVDAGDGWRLRYTGFVSEWPPRSQGGEVAENMPIRADGPIRRLSRGQVLTSAVRKAIVARGDAAGYWPLETDGASALPGVADMRILGTATFGSTSLPGSAGAVTVPFGSAMSSSIAGMPDTGAWQVSFWLDIPQDTSDISPIVTWTTPNSTYLRWAAYANSPNLPNVVTVEVADADLNDVTISGDTDIRGIGPVLVTVWARSESDGDIIVDIFLDGDLDGSGVLIDDATSPLTAAGINNDKFASTLTVSGQISHLYASASTIGSVDAEAASLAWLVDAGAGHAGERACDRIRRISAEENVPVVIVGDDGTSEPMGPQPHSTFLDLLRDCEATDGGILYERRDGRLAYQPRAARYNTAVALTLDYAAGDVAPPLEPTDDDQHTLNDYTSSRNGGGSARVFDQTHKDTVGEYASSGTVNVAYDSQLADDAGWRVHLGTADGLRYPSLTPNLNGRPALIPAWADLDVGQAIAVTNPGRDLPPGTINVITQGYTETIDTVSWTATANASPGDPWDVIVLNDNTLGRLDTTSSALAASVALPQTPGTPVVEDFEDATLNITITDGGNLPWTRTNTTAHTGSWCLRSGAITNSQTSDAIITVPAGAKACTFWYRVSSEATFDFLRVLVDSTEKAAASGESYGWQHGAVDVTGASTVTFRYAKDAFTSSGNDAAYIDDLAFITAETISVATMDGPAWTTYAGDFPFDILVGGEQMTALAAAPYATDTFTRTVSSGWGAADTGQAWTALVGPAPASDYSVSGGLGKHSLSAVNQHMFTTIPMDGGYFDISCDLGTDRLAVGGDLILYLVGRFTDVSNYYMANVGFDTSQGVSLTIRRNVAGTETHLDGGIVSGLRHAAGTRYKVRFKGDGPLLRAKIWTGLIEPDDWDVTVTDTALTSGAVGMRSLATGSYSGTLPVVASYDNVTVHPQVMTVTRSVNGVTKSHTAGEDVRLATPPTLSY